MPEVYFDVTWPDGQTQRCYSPSSTITTYFNGQQTMALQEFLNTAQQGLNHASERVVQRYGFACSSAMDQLSRIQQRAQQYSQQADASVTICCPAVDG